MIYLTTSETEIPKTIRTFGLNPKIRRCHKKSGQITWLCQQLLVEPALLCNHMENFAVCRDPGRLLPRSRQTGLKFFYVIASQIFTDFMRTAGISLEKLSSLNRPVSCNWSLKCLELSLQKKRLISKLCDTVLKFTIYYHSAKFCGNRKLKASSRCSWNDFNTYLPRLRTTNLIAQNHERLRIDSMLNNDF